MRKNEWQKNGGCVTSKVDPSIFDFSGTKLTTDNYVAIRICVRHCPVFGQCRNDLKAAPPFFYEGTIRAGEPQPLRTNVVKRKGTI